MKKKSTFTQYWLQVKEQGKTAYIKNYLKKMKFLYVMIFIYILIEDKFYYKNLSLYRFCFNAIIAIILYFISPYISWHYNNYKYNNMIKGPHI